MRLSEPKEREIELRHASEPLVFVIDIGSSSVRASLFDACGREIQATQAKRSWGFRASQEGASEIAAEELFATVTSTVDEALRLVPRELRFAEVAISCFWHSLVVLDDAGRALTPVLGWADTRARAAAALLRARLDEAETHHRTGCRFHPSYWPAKILWLREQREEIVRRAARFGSFSEFLTGRLLDRSVMSVSMAAGTGLFDQHRCVWDERLIAALGLRRESFPKVEDTREAIARLAPEWSARWPQLSEARWHAPFADGATSNIGENCSTPERAVIMIGTSGAMRVLFEGKPPRSLPLGLWCYRLDGRRVVVGGALSDGGNLREWLSRSLALEATTLEEGLAQLAPDEHGLTVLPFWSGERSTGWHAEARGAILGLSMRTRPIDIARATLEAVAYRFAAIADHLRALFPVSQIVASGGALQNSPFWAQLLADVFAHPVELSRVREASSRGAALLALEASGMLSLRGPSPTIARRFVPDQDRAARYAAARARHERLYRLVLESQTA
ncbi:MAG: carbohydrate kinase [Pyrinomonas sp.]